ncbi:two-component sensor histidine kinase [Microbispora sp. NEAU-D428]|uniref:histidine kinase n=1 Tax=Microbispora sitophila TaxID=2771537 RepID=UPI00186663F0|nr:histidine kinase [Microbispora sitophila]MBE3010612.1 two-component sensor histidine kinase [Microbispora sitophila]
MTTTRLRDVRLVPLLFGPLIGAMAVLETWLDDFFGADATIIWISGVMLGLGVLIAAWHPLAGAVVAAACLPLPLVVFGVPSIGGAALIGLIAVVAWAGWREPPRRSAVALCVAGLSFAGTSLAGGQTPWELFFVAAILLPGWFMGVLARRSGERAVELAALAAALDAEREANAQTAVAQERTRIAREVHDAVAHSVSVMTLQLGGLRRLLADRPVEQEVVAGLERLGRQTVEEMRGLVGLLRERVDGERPAPAPSLARVGELIADVRAAGLEVTVDAPAEMPKLPPILDLTAYRVLQEALTNVLRHAGKVPAAVVIDCTEHALTLDVRNGKPAGRPAVPAVRRGGHGLVGMRERLAMVRGSLQAGPEPDGGFAVRARFPIPRT